MADEQLEECWSQAVSELEETPYNEDVYAIVMKGDETLIGFTLIHGSNGNIIGGMTMAGAVM